MVGHSKRVLVNWRSLASAVTIVVLLAATGCLPTVPPVEPELPSKEALETDGPFEVESMVVDGPGFNTGTVYYPTGATGPVSVLLAMPGFRTSERSMSWMGPRIASHGFAVFTLTAESGNDFPAERGRQLNGALTWLTGEVQREASTLYGRIDTSRVAFTGHSMGGGASLLAVGENPAVRTVIPLAPWILNPNVGPLGIPTLTVACQNDLPAPVAFHARPIYRSLAEEKMFLEFAGAAHGCPAGTSENIPVLGRFMISWLKVFLDEDARYDAYVCGPELADETISRLESTCPVL